VHTDRVSLGRVPIDGVVRSTRAGGWQGHTVAALLARYGGADDPLPVRLGMRLYFIAMLGKGQQQSFRDDLLSHAIDRAGRLLADAGGAADPTVADPTVAEFVRRNGGPHGHVDPYRLTSTLLSKHCRGPIRDVALRVLT
jgi:hypothetical protein